MKELTWHAPTCNDRVLEKALEVAEDIYFGEDKPGDKDLLDMLVDFLDADKVPDNDWDFLCSVNGGETCDYWDSYEYGEGRRRFKEMRNLI